MDDAIIVFGRTLRFGFIYVNARTLSHGISTKGADGFAVGNVCRTGSLLIWTVGSTKSYLAISCFQR